MRILHVLDHSLPLQSGYVYRTLGILGAQRGYGWDTMQVTSPRYNASAHPMETVDGWDFYRTQKPSSPLGRVPVAAEILEMRATERRLSALIAEAQPDIVHAHSPVLNGIPALRAARKAGLPMIYEVRALWEDAAVDLGRSREGGARYRATRALETYVMRRATAVITLCEAMRSEIIGRSISADRVAVVPNAVNLDDFGTARARDTALAEKLNLAGRVVLGFIGSFYHYEGLDLLLRALPAIRAARPDAVLLLVGGGPEDERLRNLSQELNLGDAVRFVGRVPHAEVRRYYDLVDFFVYPRRSMRLTELVTPLKPLEAMAESRIVIASDVGGHRELVRDGETGFLFPPDDPDALAKNVIRAMAADTANMRAAGRHYVETSRAWPISASAYKPIYELAVTRRRR